MSWAEHKEKSNERMNRVSSRCSKHRQRDLNANDLGFAPTPEKERGSEEVLLPAFSMTLLRGSKNMLHKQVRPVVHKAMGMHKDQQQVLEGCRGNFTLGTGHDLLKTIH